VSSFPVLTAAVVRRLARGMTRLDSVTGGIAPSPHAGIGLNVIRAVASYAGKPVRVRRDGRADVGYGLVETRRYTIAPPGRLPLRRTLFRSSTFRICRRCPRCGRSSIRSGWASARRLKSCIAS